MHMFSLLLALPLLLSLSGHKLSYLILSRIFQSFSMSVVFSLVQTFFYSNKWPHNGSSSQSESFFSSIIHHRLETPFGDSLFKSKRGLCWIQLVPEASRESMPWYKNNIHFCSCVSFADVSLTKTNYMAKPRFKEWSRFYLMLEVTTAHWKEISCRDRRIYNLFIILT